MKKPNNWQLVEMYEGNYIFEDEKREFQVSVDNMGGMTPPYHIQFNQLKGQFIKISLENGAYSTDANDEDTAIQKAYEMMKYLNQVLKKE